MRLGFASRLSAAAALGASLGAVLVLTACDGGASAVKARKAGEAGEVAAARPASDLDPPARYADAAPRSDPRDAPVPKVAGKPMWAASRTRTAQENAERGFERNGGAFAAADVDDYVRKAHAFVADPPAGAETLQRANGDTLIYDPKGNVFAVVTKAGAPRALFKPDDGAAYWTQQKSRESRRTTASRDRGATGGANDNG
jgi:pyocin large subunit-like protein